jgi:hypothetical protein
MHTSLCWHYKWPFLELWTPLCSVQAPHSYDCHNYPLLPHNSQTPSSHLTLASTLNTFSHPEDGSSKFLQTAGTNLHHNTITSHQKHPEHITWTVIPNKHTLPSPPPNNTFTCLITKLITYYHLLIHRHTLWHPKGLHHCARQLHFLLYPLTPHEQKFYCTLCGHQHRKWHALYSIPSSSSSSPSTGSPSSKPKKSEMKNRIQV